jgi:hypothetical protein
MLSAEERVMALVAATATMSDVRQCRNGWQEALSIPLASEEGAWKAEARHRTARRQQRSRAGEGISLSALDLPRGGRNADKINTPAFESIAD